MAVSRDMKRKYDLLNALISQERPNLSDLSEATSIPQQSIKRHFGAMRTDFGLKLRFVRESGGQRGSYGYYAIEDWGILDKDGFLKHYGKF